MAARRPALRSVPNGAKSEPVVVVKPSPKSLSQAAADGSTRELLVAMRDRIALAVEDKNTPARDLAALSKRLMEVVRDIEAVDARAVEEAHENAEHPDEAWDAEAL